ncbi:hypothetical protein F5Y16DRAFT_404515 [Xylariaceae sp. FL0255]|nr:hypothetical protein F5Y16DRAFT_404515 [Xylariaceae sp. FL0255]
MLLVHIVTVDHFGAPSPYGNFESGFHTDLEDWVTSVVYLETAKHYAEGKRVQFTGSVAFYENGTMYRQYNHNEPSHSGCPNPEVGKAWNDLIHGSGIDLRSDTIGRHKGQAWEEINGGEGDMWRAG